MKRAQIKIGNIYEAKVSNLLVPIRIDRESPFRKGWEGTNMKTKKAVRIKSAARLRREWWEEI